MDGNRRRILKKKRRKKYFVYSGIGFFLVLYTLFWKTYVEVNNTVGGMFKGVESNNKRDAQVFITDTQPISFAFLGIDNGVDGRTEEFGRSDAILVGTVNPLSKTTTLVSIPRDTYALMEGYETFGEDLFYDKLTHAYAYGEAEMSLNSIQELINIPIDYFVEINMQGLIDIVDSLSGIDVISPLSFEERGFIFEKGEEYHMTGEQALLFARMRKKDSEGDLGRQKREKLVIKAIIDKFLSLDSIVNYQSILQTLEKNVKTNLSFKDMQRIISSYSKSLDNFKQDNLLGDELWLDDVYYLYVPPENRLELSNLLRNELNLNEINLEDLNLSDFDYTYLSEGEFPVWEQEEAYYEGYEEVEDEHYNDWNEW